MKIKRLVFDLLTWQDLEKQLTLDSYGYSEIPGKIEIKNIKHKNDY